MSYPGGKGALYQWLINQIPPHDIFISTHLGQCAIMRYKRPARINIGIDLDETVIDAWRYELGPGLPVDHTARSGDTGDRLALWAAARQGQPLGSEITGASGARCRLEGRRVRLRRSALSTQHAQTIKAHLHPRI